MSNCDFKERESKFSIEHFFEPSKKYAPIYSWVWNAPVSKEETDKQLNEFVRLGVKAFYIIPEPKMFRPFRIPTLMEPDYLTEPYFEAYKYALEQAFAKGMLAWIYDEGGWPSGGACGKVLLAHPEYARQGLAGRKIMVRAGVPYEPDESICSSFLVDGTQIEAGIVFEQDTEVEEYYAKRFLFEQTSSDYPDATRKEATDCFIEITHENYKKYLKDYFGDKISAIFCDEPEAPRPVPFRKELEEEYEKRYGVSIRPHLRTLLRTRFEQPTEVSQEAAQAMIRWYDLCSEWFCENFMLVEKEWCNKNGLDFTGHMNGDDIPMGSVRSASYHLMRALRCFDIPGVDAIWRQIFPADAAVLEGENICQNKFFPRYASSAAAQVGRDDSVSETFGVYGVVSFDQMRYALGFQAIRGITIFNNMLFSYGREGFLQTSELPHFGEEKACYGDMKAFNEYLERLSYLSCLGERDVSIALYLPMNDIWSGVNTSGVCSAYEKAGFELEESGLYFDIFDDDVVRVCDDSALSHGEIRMGKACYKTLVIAPCAFMPEETIRKIEAFILGGGRVYVVDGASVPSIQGAIQVKDCKHLLPSTVDFVENTSNIRVYERTLEDGRLTLIFNQSFKKEEFSIRVKEGGLYLVDITAGKLRALQKDRDRVRLIMQSGETIGLLYSDKQLQTTDIVTTNTINLEGEYRFRKTRQFLFNEMTHLQTEIQEKEIDVPLGDWREYTGWDFSGSGVYKTTFARPIGLSNGLILDLGEVKYTCEVFLNGKSLGVKTMSPYRYEISSDLIMQENILEIRVSNTIANALLSTKMFDKWAKWQLSPYFVKALHFSKDYLESGLIGPVKLKY